MNRMPYMVENTGSTARDFAMLERNILSHVKLAVILSLLSSSLLLHARLVPSEDEGDNQQRSGVILGSFEFAAAILSLAAGAWEYYRGYWDLRKARAFLASPQTHLIGMGIVSGIIFGTCVVLLVQATQ